MLAALRYRRAQALVLVLLSSLVTACLVIAPLYTRALDQATARTLLRDAPVQDSGLRLTSTSSTEPSLALPPDQLTALVPAEIRGWFGAAVTSTGVNVRRLPLAGQPGGRLLARDGACDHVRFTSGRCPTARGEVAVSADQAAAYAMPVGTGVDVGEFDATVSSPEAAPRTTLQVVGVYEQVDGPFWFGDRLTGAAAQKSGWDTMLTPTDTLTASVTSPTGTPATWFQRVYASDLPLQVDRVGVDEVGPLGAAVTRLGQYPMGVEQAASRSSETVTVRSALPAIADQVRTGSEQAAVTVPLLMAQLGLLLVCVLWLVLVAAADQRRGEVAVARLRGRGARGARRLLLGETLPFVLVGVPFGALLAVGATSIARHSVLTGDPPFEIPVPAVLALLGAVALIAAVTVLSVRRVSREPVATLVRTVPPRATGVRLGVLEAMLVAAAVAAFVAVATGSVGGPVGQVAPTLLALAVGVVAARVLAWVLGAGGRALLRAGRPTSGAALLTASRRGTTRWLVPVVVVALALVVVTADALAVGVRNWSGRAAAEVGAPAVLTLGSSDLVAVTTAVTAVDPSAQHLTPVVTVPPAQGGTTTMGVVPGAFRRIASFPGVDPSSLSWDALTAPTVAPLVLTGTRLTYRLDASPIGVVTPAIRPAPTSLALALRVVRRDGSVDTVPVGTLPDGGATGDQQATITCADGCRVAGIGVTAPLNTAAVTGTVTVSDLAVDGTAVDLGGSGSWRDTSVDEVSVTGTFGAGSLRLGYATNGSDQAFLAHASVPTVVPALTTPAATPSSTSATFAGAYVDGSPLSLRYAGALRYAPGGPAATSLVNLDNLLAQGWRGRGSAVTSVYVDTADPAYLTQVTSALAARGVPVVGTTRTETVAAAYGRSAAAWGLQLAVAVGALSILVAGVGIVVLASTSARARSRDYAALRLVGQRRRGLALLAQLETAPVIVGSALLGAAVGLWAAPAAVGLVPLFTSTPPTYPVDLRTAWLPALLAAVAGVVVLALVGTVTSARAARRADLSRLRDPS